MVEYNPHFWITLFDESCSSKDENEGQHPLHLQILTCQIILTKESHNEKAEIILHLKGKDFVAIHSSKSFEKSINMVVDKIISQLKKQHDKLIKH